MTPTDERVICEPTRPLCETAIDVGEAQHGMRRPTVSVDELQRAWAAIRSGWFRDTRPTRQAPLGAVVWQPTESTIVVAGAAARTGTTTVALAIATAAARRVRVVECCDPARSGLTAASTAELGTVAGGTWRQARRDHVLIERLVPSATGLPGPAGTEVDASVVDAGPIGACAVGCAPDDGTWLDALLIEVPTVIVTVATVPGIRALNVAVEGLGSRADVWCAVMGPRRKKWPAQVVYEMSPAVAAIEQAGRLVVVPEHRDLAVNGLTADSLPPDVVAAGGLILDGAVTVGAAVVEAVAS